MNNKAKGSNGERIVAKIFSKWMGAKNKEVWLWRSPNSGGAATMNKCYENTSGDLVAINDKALILLNFYSIEIKTGYKDACLDKCLKDNKNEDFRDFWIQCVGDANKANKLPLLIYNKSGSLPKNMWIGFCDNGIEMLSKLQDLVSISIKFDKKYELPNLNLFNFQDFLDNISIEDFHATN